MWLTEGAAPFPVASFKSDPDGEKRGLISNKEVSSHGGNASIPKGEGLCYNQPTPLHPYTILLQHLNAKTYNGSPSVSKSKLVVVSQITLPFDHRNHLIVALVSYNMIDEVQLPTWPAKKTERSNMTT